MSEVGIGRASSSTELFRTYVATHDPQLRDQLIESHLGLVQQLARRFANRGEPLDDLIQAGSIGLIKAVERFDPELGFEFSAYATRTVLGELKRHFRDKGWTIRAPRRIQELYLSIGHSVEELSQRYGRPPTIRELAELTGAGTEDLLEALEAGNAYRASSLDAPGPEGEPIGNRLGHDESAYLTAEERLVLLPHLAALPEREKLILELRFGEDLTQAQIAERIGISQMHVSRILARSLAMLHAACNPPE